MLTWATYKHKETNKIWVPKTREIYHDTQNKTNPLNKLNSTQPLTKTMESKTAFKHKKDFKKTPATSSTTVTIFPLTTQILESTKSNQESHQSQHTTNNQNQKAAAQFL